MEIGKKDWVEKYVEPVLQHPLTAVAAWAVVEVVRDVAAKLFLDGLGKLALDGKNSAVSSKDIYHSTIFAPVGEELLFRLLIQRTIYLLQLVWNDFNGKELTDEEHQNQLAFRVHFTAIAFGLAHLLNSHRYWETAAIQCAWSYIGGLVYGHLSEKYQTLSVNILAHGINNFLTCAAKVYPAYAKIILVAVIVHKVVLLILVTPIFDDICELLSKIPQFFKNLSEKGLLENKLGTDHIGLAVVTVK